VKRKTTEQFIEEAVKVHGDKYNYSKVEYTNKRTKVIITCSIHGVFEQFPNDHLIGKGCKICGHEKSSNSQRSNTEEFIKRAVRIHGNKFDYSKSNYIDSKTIVVIICKIHGGFKQEPVRHLRGQGCRKCATLKRLKTTKEFIKKAEKIHNYMYDYSKTDYKGSKEKVIIICPKHGEFEQNPSHHLQGHGCPKCFRSKGEEEIEKLLKNNNINFKSQVTFNGCKYKKPLRFDFYLPDYDICIEYDGIQHFEPVMYWGGENGFKEQQIKDKVKTKYCKDNKIKLIRIPYTEFNNIEEILKAEI